MSNLNSLFDVVRGWTGTGSDSATITETFRPHANVAANNPLREGDIVFQQSDGKVDRANGADFGSAATIAALAELMSAGKQFWLVVDGNESSNYDTLIQTGNVGPNGTLAYQPYKVTCIRGVYMVETDNAVARSYAPGSKVTIVNGQIDITDATNNVGFQAFGEVREYDAVSGKLTVTV